ncbi:hypothetical protein L7F22_034086 [Adiantum nelumboides]|nr:hypothetical protein [Adiantum nelumboides]
MWEAIRYRALPYSVNMGIIKLLHKKGASEDLCNWRPLTMLNSCYKIFAKVVAIRITPILMKWISTEQKGFIKGRRTIEAIIALWEGIEHAEDLGLDYVFVKIDFDKAYDCLKWSFILLSLEKMGFGLGLIRFVTTLFGHVRARGSLNGAV